MPAYGWAIALPVTWLLRRITAGRFTVRRWIGSAAKIASWAVCSIVLLASVALPVAVPVFHFPSPTGLYGIGTTTYHWVDMTRPEPITADAADHRELMAQVWYPATPAPDATRAPYIADAEAVTPALAQLTGLLPFLFSHFRYVTTNAVEHTARLRWQAPPPTT